MQKKLRNSFLKKFKCRYFFLFLRWLKNIKNICHFVTFEKSKTTCPFNENEASRLSYLTELLNKLPGEHIPLLKSSCLVSKPLAEAIVIVRAWLNPATADPIKRCICSPLRSTTVLLNGLKLQPTTVILHRLIGHWSKFTEMYCSFYTIQKKKI